MATAQLTWFGATIEFDDPEIMQIATLLNTGSAMSGVVAAVSALIPAAFPATAAAAAVAALYRLGSTLLTQCNSRRNGIELVVLWVGSPLLQGQVTDPICARIPRILRML